MISSGLFVLPGIVFAKAGPSIILAYIVAGILVLPAIAQIVHEPGFGKRWASARDVEALRDLVLLGRRTRQ